MRNQKKCCIFAADFQENVEDGGFRVTIWRKTHIVNTKTHIVDTKTHIVKLTKKQQAVVDFCETPKSSREIFAHIGIMYQSRAVKRYITDLIEMGYLLPLDLGKTNDPHRKYIAAHRD